MTINRGPAEAAKAVPLQQGTAEPAVAAEFAPHRQGDPQYESVHARRSKSPSLAEQTDFARTAVNLVALFAILVCLMFYSLTAGGWPAERNEAGIMESRLANLEKEVASWAAESEKWLAHHEDMKRAQGIADAGDDEFERNLVATIGQLLDVCIARFGDRCTLIPAKNADESYDYVVEYVRVVDA